MSKLDLPSGGVAELRDLKVRPVKVKERKAVLAAYTGDTGWMDAMAAIIAMLVESWTLDLPLPSENIGSLDELDVADYDALEEATQEIQNMLFSTPAKGDPADPKAGSGS